MITIQQDPKVLILSEAKHKPFAMQYMLEGASGFYDKSCSEEDLILAVELVLSDQIYLSKDVLQSQIKIQNSHLISRSDTLNKLSKREYEVFKLLIEGKQIKEISKEMEIHQSTTSTLKNGFLVNLMWII